MGQETLASFEKHSWRGAPLPSGMKVDGGSYAGGGEQVEESRALLFWCREPD
jgi:hypothetical protein